MMSCQKIQEELWEYQNQQLSADLMRGTAEHLKSCAACALQFENFKLVDAELAHLDEIEPSPFFNQRLDANLDALLPKRTWAGFLAFRLKDRYALSFVVLFIATVIVWVGFRHKQAEKLSSMEELLKAQQKYLGDMEGSPKEVVQEMAVPREGLSQTESKGQTENFKPEEDFIPEEDRAVVENLDLLENYDFIQQIELADSSSEVRRAAKSN